MKKDADKNKRKRAATAPSQAFVEGMSPVKGTKKESFYIVGMGGSAGGLEAFGPFFNHMPTDSGMAFVLVPHLDPTHKGMMPELLQRHTKMQVFQAEEGMEVRPNCVYVIPPNRDMSIQHNCSNHWGLAVCGCRLISFSDTWRKTRKSGLLVPSFREWERTAAWASRQSRKNWAWVMAQDVSSAKYDSMPRSAIATGLVDYIAPVEELPVKLLGYAKYSSAILKEKPAISTIQKWQQSFWITT